MNFYLKKNLGCYLVLMLTLFSVSAESKLSAAQAHITVFDGYCFQNYNNYSNIKHMVKAVGGKTIPQSLVNGDPTLRGLGGSAYTMVYEKKMYIIGYAENASCSVMTKSFEVNNTIDLLKELYSMKLLQKNTSGIQVTEIYEIINDSTHDGATLSIAYAKSSSGLDVGTISFVPAKTMRRILDNN